MTSLVVGFWKKNPKNSQFFNFKSEFFLIFHKNGKKLENSTHLFIVNLIWANFEPNQRNFLAVGRWFIIMII